LSDIWNELNCTIVFVTHDITAAVFLADDIWVMDSNPGRIVYRKIIDELPSVRDLTIKRDPVFIRLTQDIEDIVRSII
jgi:NitT/TauT family transport system ATP-binding protein